MQNIILVLLVLIILLLIVRLSYIKRQMRSITEQLGNEDFNLITVQLMDEDLERLVLHVNQLLDRTRQTLIGEEEASDALKSSIVNISHDMKTPLTSVMGYLQLALKNTNDESLQEMLRICLERTKYCNSLINDFFELSKIEADEYRAELKQVDITAEICEQILANYPNFKEKGIEPHFPESDGTVIAYVDEKMFQRVIQNLISNAIKYSIGSEIIFHVEKSENIIITVSNQVEGQIDTEHIFDKFYTEDSSRMNGFGIGLFICKEFMHKMNGSITANQNGKILEIKIILSV